VSTINFFGLASGLNSGSLISAILDQKRVSRIDPLQAKISNFEKTNSAFNTLSEKLGALKNAASAFRTLEGGAVSKNVSVSDESVLSATAKNGALNSSISINVSQVASNATSSFNDTFSSTSSVINSGASPGTVDFTIGSGANQESVSVSVDSTTTAEQFVQSFNNSSNKASASLVNVGSSESPQYKIVISSLSEGSAEGQIATTDNSAFFSGQTLNQATDAQFTISGIAGTITRSSNSITDVLPGVTLNLKKAGSTTVTVGSDVEASSASFEKFVNAYNDLVNFVKNNDQVKFELKNGKSSAQFGPLSNTSIDESALSTIKSALTSSSVSGSSIATLADLGITTEKDGTLKFNKNTFESALSTNSDAVKNIAANVGETLSSVGGTIDKFTQFKGIIGSAVQSNKESIGRLQTQIYNLEQSLSKQEESLIRQFSKLEGLVGKLQSQQQIFNSTILDFRIAKLNK